MGVSIRIAESDADIARCFPVMQQLRTHLVESEFLPRIRNQEKAGFRLLFLEDGGTVRAVAGYRFMDNLFSGRILYVDDLVTDTAARSKGYGKALIDRLADMARAGQCVKLELDSGVQRFDAHRFYLACRMAITSHHFTLKL